MKALALIASATLLAAPCTAGAATPTARFQDASLIGAGQTIVVGRVPVINAAGKVTYYDVTIAFSVTSGGQLALSQTQAPPTLSPKLIVAGFKAGNYSSNSSAPVAVTGPGIGGPGGQTAWSLAATTGSCTQPPSATWYTGPIAQNPYAKRLEAAKITQTQYSFGIIGGGTSCSTSWPGGGIVGAQQIGDTLVLYSFSYGSTDYAAPITQTVFTLQTP